MDVVIYWTQCDTTDYITVKNHPQTIFQDVLLCQNFTLLTSTIILNFSFLSCYLMIIFKSDRKLSSQSMIVRYGSGTYFSVTFSLILLQIRRSKIFTVKEQDCVRIEKATINEIEVLQKNHRNKCIDLNFGMFEIEHEIKIYFKSKTTCIMFEVDVIVSWILKF